MPLVLSLAMGAFFLSPLVPPGPVNLAIVASGANRDFRRTLLFVTDATPGFILLLASVGFWFAHTIEAYPHFFDYLEMAGVASAAHVGCRIATMDPRLAPEENGVPGFFQGMSLQWLNPKVWIACTPGVVLFTSLSMYASLLVSMAVYSVVCYLSLTVWVSLDDCVALLLDSLRRVHLFNRVMNGTLVLTVGYMLYL